MFLPVCKYFIKLSDIAVMTYPILDYWKYNNPIKLSEYMYFNKYIICSNIGPFVEMVRNGNSVIINEITKKSLIKTYVGCIKDIDKIRLLNLENKSRNYILENYTWEKQAAKIVLHITRNTKSK